MAFGDKGQQPLYMSVIQRILRDMRIEQQTTRSRFKYALFANKLDKEPLTPDQRRPLNQRLDTLESFLVQARPSWEPRTSRKALVGTDWRPQVSSDLPRWHLGRQWCCYDYTNHSPIARRTPYCRSILPLCYRCYGLLAFQHLSFRVLRATKRILSNPDRTNHRPGRGI